MRADFELRSEPPVARLRVAGELDLSTGDEPEKALGFLAASGCRFVDLDLLAVTFVDAYSLAVLHREQRRLRAAGGDLRVVAASAWYQDVCRLADYDGLQPPSNQPPHLRLLHARRHLRALPDA